MHRAIAMAEIAGAAGLHRASLLRKMRSTRCARRATAACRRSPKPARSICCSRIEELDAPGFRRRQVRLHAAAAREIASAETVGRAEARSSAGGLHRPLPVLLRGSEGAGQGRFHQNSQRRAGHRESAAASSITTASITGKLLREPLRRSRLDHAGQNLRPVSRARATHRRRQRCRHRDLGSRSATTSSAPRPITCAWITRCSKVSLSRESPKQCSLAAKPSSTAENLSAAQAPVNSSADKPTTPSDRLRNAPRRSDLLLRPSTLRPLRCVLARSLQTTRPVQISRSQNPPPNSTSAASKQCSAQGDLCAEPSLFRNQTGFRAREPIQRKSSRSVVPGLQPLSHRRGSHAAHFHGGPRHRDRLGRAAAHCWLALRHNRRGHLGPHQLSRRERHHSPGQRLVLSPFRSPQVFC